MYDKFVNLGKHTLTTLFVSLGFEDSGKHIHVKSDKGFMKPLPGNSGAYFWIHIEGVFDKQFEWKKVTIQIINASIKDYRSSKTINNLIELIDYMSEVSYHYGKIIRSAEFKSLIEG